MDREEILDFVRRNPTSSLAPVEGVEPRVRKMETAHVDETGIHFLTSKVKEVGRQLSDDPSVELCYWSPDEKKQLRIRGEMEELEDDDLKRSIVETRFTFLKPIVEEHGLSAFALYRLGKGRACTWTPDAPSGGKDLFEF